MIKRVSLLLLLVLLITGCNTERLPDAALPIHTDIDPTAWVTVPAGSFLFGLHEASVELPYDYQIMVTDVTNAQFAAYLNQAISEGKLKIKGAANDAANDDVIGVGEVVGFYPGDVYHGKKHEARIDTGDWPHYPLRKEGLRIVYAGNTFTPLAGYENHPVTMVTWFGAKAYCEAQDGRLPTEQEWEKAARGAADNRAYPWGDQLDRNRANYYSSRDVFEKTLGKAGDTTPVGFYNGKAYEGYVTLDGASPYGLYDMAGNVWQWTANVYEGTHYRYLRGGSKADYGYNLRVWTRNNVRPDYKSPSVGFRCVKDANEHVSQ